MAVPVFGANWDSDSDVLAPSMLESVAIWRMTMLVIFILMFVLTTVLNTMFLVFFFRKPSLRNISNRFICSLTFCNLITGWVLFPIVIIDMLQFNNWTDENLLEPVYLPYICHFFNAVVDFTTAASVFSTTLIAMDRFIAITNPLHYHMMVTKTRSWLFILGGWMMALIAGSASLLVQPSTDTWNICNYAENPAYLEWRSLILSVGSLIICFALPFGVLLWAYFHIYRAAQQNSERARSSSVCGPSADLMDPAKMTRNVSRTPSTRSASSQIVSNIRRRLSNASLFLYKEESRAAKISVGVVILFIVCWLPFYVLKVVIAAFPYLQIPPYIHKTCVLLTYLNTMVSPYLYIYRSKRMKKEVWKILGFQVRSEYENKYQPYQQLSSNLEVPSLRTMYGDKISYINPVHSTIERKQSLLATYISQQILCEEGSSRPPLCQGNSTSSSISSNIANSEDMDNCPQ